MACIGILLPCQAQSCHLTVPVPIMTFRHLCLPGSQHLSSAASAFGTKAWELHALQQMAGMLLHPGMQPEGPLASLCRRPMQCLLSLVLIAVSLQPASTPPAEMDAIAQCLEGIFDGTAQLAPQAAPAAP